MGLLKEPKDKRGLPQGKPSTFLERIVRFKPAPDPKLQRDLKRELRKGIRWFLKEAKTL